MTLWDSQSEPGSKREQAGQRDRQTEAANGAAGDGKGQKTQVKPEAGG